MNPKERCHATKAYTATSDALSNRRHGFNHKMHAHCTIGILEGTFSRAMGSARGRWADPPNDSKLNGVDDSPAAVPRGQGHLGSTVLRISTVLNPCLRLLPLFGSSWPSSPHFCLFASKINAAYARRLCLGGKVHGTRARAVTRRQDVELAATR